jgi:hypothetical protein
MNRYVSSEHFVMLNIYKQKKVIFEDVSIHAQ